MTTPILLDGSFGEGGGQILRSALSLSMVTRTPFLLENVRAGRSKPGLQRQHLTALQAAIRIAQAEARGAELHSQWVSFQPRGVAPGEHHFDIGSAGSASLVFQTLLPALMFADRPSRLVITGGTHNIHAPPYEFLEKSYLPLLRRMGAKVEIALERRGFAPGGGGRIVAEIEPIDKLASLELIEAGPIVQRRARALIANLPRHIAERETNTIAQMSGWPPEALAVEEVQDALGPGNVVLIEIERPEVTEVFTGFGRIGVRAEQVAAGAWREAKRYLEADVPAAEHLADQLLLPLGLGAGLFGSGGAFRTLDLTEHSRTHIAVLRRFLQVDIDVQSQRKDDMTVRVGPA